MTKISAMATFIRDIGGHDWGWFSREDERMHIQSVDPESRAGPGKVKVWLENRGTRIFEHAGGRIDAKALKRLLAEVRKKQDEVESMWTWWCVQKDWIGVALHDSVVTLTMYPTSHNSYERTLDLRAELPGIDWAKPPVVDLDPETGLLRVGPASRPPDRRASIPLENVLFHGHR